MPRVTVYHLTLPARLPLIEEEGLRTRADLSGLLGEIDDFDRAAPGTFANGRRVTGWLSYDHARGRVDDHGVGLVSYTVDPAKALAAPASTRTGDHDAYWAGAEPLALLLAGGDVAEDLEVHQNVPVRSKHLRMHAPLCTSAQLGDYAPLVDAVADADRLSAKALMHLAIVASDGEFEGEEFVAACALAWRDEPDADDLSRELVETDPDKVASAALAEHSVDAPEAVSTLRGVLEETREWARAQGLEPGQAIFERSAAVLDRLEGGR